MPKTKTIRVSEEELAALKAFRESAKATDTPLGDEQSKAVLPDSVVEAQKALANAFVEAIERTKPPAKVTIANRKPRTPWTPVNGEAREKMKRKFFHHGLLMDERLSNDEIRLLNKVRPGVYCDGWVRVTLRKDRGIDIDYPVRTASQRLKLVNSFGIRSFTELLERIIDERATPAKYRSPVDKDLYDLED